MSFQKTFFIIILILFSFELYSQNIELDKLWVGSYRINRYEADERMHTDTTEHFESVLWFTENEINMVFFRNDCNKLTTYLDTIRLKYSIDGNSINLNNDTLKLQAVIDNNILKIKHEYAELTYLNPNIKYNQKIDIDLISNNLTNSVWEINFGSWSLYEEFLPNNKYKEVGHPFYDAWYLYKILDYYFIVTTNYNERPAIRLIEDITPNEIRILIFKNEMVERYSMIKSEEN